MKSDKILWNKQDTSNQSPNSDYPHLGHSGPNRMTLPIYLMLQRFSLFIMEDIITQNTAETNLYYEQCQIKSEIRESGKQLKMMKLELPLVLQLPWE